MNQYGIGQPVRRKEDQRLLTGKGEFGDDLNLPNQVYAAVLRSPHAHARLLGIDASAALKQPAAIAVLTGAHYRADGLPPIPNNPVPTNNPLGIKGAGEGGSTGAPPAIINAVVDALKDYGVRDITMPATSERIWQAIQQGDRRE